MNVSKQPEKQNKINALKQLKIKDRKYWFSTPTNFDGQKSDPYINPRKSNVIIA